MYFIVYLFIIILLIFAIIWRLISNKLLIDMNGNAILITGSSEGFGKHFVKKCVNNGITVFAACLTSEGVETLFKECDNENKCFLYAFQMDIADSDSVQNAKLLIENKLLMKKKKLSAIVNNAGVLCECFYDDMLSLDDYIDALKVNTFGTIRVIKAFKQMIKQNKGRIVVCTSSCILFPTPGFGPYTVSKCALNGYLEVIRHELYDFGVKVITIEPGIFRTSINETSKMMKAMNMRWSKTDVLLKKEYGEYWFSLGKHLCVKLLNGAPTDISPVSNAYYHAIAARYPNYNYTVGLDATFIYRPFSWFPVQLQVLCGQIMKWLIGAPKADVLD